MHTRGKLFEIQATMFRLSEAEQIFKECILLDGKMKEFYFYWYVILQAFFCMFVFIC